MSRHYRLAFTSCQCLALVPEVLSVADGGRCFLQRMIALGCAVGVIALLPVYWKHFASRRAAAQALPELVKKPE